MMENLKIYFVLQIYFRLNILKVNCIFKYYKLNPFLHRKSETKATSSSSAIGLFTFSYEMTTYLCP